MAQGLLRTRMSIYLAFLAGEMYLSTPTITFTRVGESRMSELSDLFVGIVGSWVKSIAGASKTTVILIFHRGVVLSTIHFL